jgi:hypothetical protein
MANTDTFPVDDSGLTPHHDPITQKLEQVTVDGSDFWQVTNYSIEEANDGTALYTNLLADIRDRKIRSAQLAKSLALTTEEQQEIATHISALQACTQFPIGFAFPNEPVCVTQMQPVGSIDFFIRDQP